MTSRKRLVFFFAIVIVLFIVLAIRLGQIQIINADEYYSPGSGAARQSMFPSLRNGEISTIQTESRWRLTSR